jgi:hypothetical protein
LFWWCAYQERCGCISIKEMDNQGLLFVHECEPCILHGIIHDVKEKDDFSSLAECGLGLINFAIVSQEIKRGLYLWMMYGCYQFENSFMKK